MIQADECEEDEEVENAFEAARVGERSQDKA